MNVISLCSGAGGLDLGLHRAGHRTVALCEIDPWRRRLLAARFPGVPVHPDLETLDPADLPDAGLLAGGTPCQDLSDAGRRAGLDGERSGLYWHYQRIRLALGIEWALWENVAGALSSNRGLDFAQILAAFVGGDVVVRAGGWPGAGVAAGPWGGCVWRVLDAQHFGVPQRRRRVFVVGRLGGPCPPEVLLEPAGSGGDPQTRRGARARVAAPLTRGSSSAGVSGPGRRQEDDLNIVNALDRRRGGADDNEAQAGHLVAHTLRAEGFGASEDGTGRGTPLTVVDSASPDPNRVRAPDGLARRVDVAGVKLSQTTANGHNEFSDIAPTLDQAAGRLAVGIRELTPGDRSAHDPQPDGRRYAACGDGVVASVAEWIGRRLAEAA